MELIFFYLLALLFCLSLLIFLAPKFQNGQKNLPPGRTGWPIIGETLDLISVNVRGTPEKFFKDRMNQFSSEIFRTSLFGQPMAVLCGAAGNKFLFSNENTLVSGWMPESVQKIFPATTQIEDLTHRRKMVGSFLKPEALKKYVGTMDVVAKQHLETYWDSKREVTVYPLAKSYTFELACRLFFSIEDPKEIAELFEPFEVLFAGLISLPIDLPGTRFNGAIKAQKFIRKKISEIIGKRKSEMKPEKQKHDILSHMLTTPDESGRFLNEMEIVDIILGALVAGHETASSTITLVIKYLAELPQVYDAVFKEQTEIAMSMQPGEQLKWEDLQKMTYSWNVACETMRLSPPSPGTFRQAIVDFNFAGFSVPKGMKLHWNVQTTHRNPQYFPEPEKFDPLRFERNKPISYSFVPFGGGPRMCPGAEYARLEILVFMHNLVRRFKWEKLRPDEIVEVVTASKPKYGLPIRLFPR